MADVYIPSSPGIINFTGEATLIIEETTPEWNPYLDYTYFCNANKDDNGIGQGVGVIHFSGAGSRLEVDFQSEPGIITFSGAGDTPDWFLINSLPGIINFSGFGEAYAYKIGRALVRWSKIGHADFTMGKTNEAGEKPLEWQGYVYRCLKLGDSVIAYGQNGVSVMKAVGLIWGNRTILSIGLKSKNAVCVDNPIEPKMHFFIDKMGRFYTLTSDGLSMVDYSNWFASLTNQTVLSYDPALGNVHICDGTLGFIYNVASKGLGKGPNNITGIGYWYGTSYIASPTPIVNEPMEFWTDIIDMSSRQDKFVYGIDFGTAIAADLYGAIAYRWDKSKDFFQTPWVKADRYGTVHLMASGIEIKVGGKSAVFTSCRMDYISILLMATSQKAGNA